MILRPHSALLRSQRVPLFATLASALLLAISQADVPADRETSDTRRLEIGHGWAQTSINTTIFRKNSVTSDKTHQYVAYYDPQSYVVLAKRLVGDEDWTIRQTPYQGNVLDAHNSISIALDGDGYLHMAWDHHGDPLRYCRSVKPGSLELTEKLPMLGKDETNVTYPEFYSIGDGDLLFLYRDGESGRGNLVMNRCDRKSREWERIQDKLIDGENERNAYWQVSTVPGSETIHVSWVWRETWDVSTNHDISYAVSNDGGETWLNTSGERYDLPITLETAELAWRIPQESELINQTSMCSDSAGRPYIATYWTPERSSIPQFHLVYHDGSRWNASQIGERKQAFSLSGAGTKRIPVSRPQIMADASGENNRAYLVFRDEERGGRASVAICENLRKPQWRFENLTDVSLGQWEPSYDIPLWERSKKLNLFIQKTGQGDGEKTEDLSPQPVAILEWVPEG